LEAFRSEELFGVWKTRSRPSRPKSCQVLNQKKAIVDPVFAFVTHARKRLFMLPFEKNQVWSGPEQPLARGRTATNKPYQIEINQVLKLFF